MLKENLETPQIKFEDNLKSARKPLRGNIAVITLKGRRILVHLINLQLLLPPHLFLFPLFLEITYAP